MKVRIDKAETWEDWPHQHVQIEPPACSYLGPSFTNVSCRSEEIGSYAMLLVIKLVSLTSQLYCFMAGAYALRLINPNDHVTGGASFLSGVKRRILFCTLLPCEQCCREDVCHCARGARPRTEMLAKLISQELTLLALFVTRNTFQRKHATR